MFDFENYVYFDPSGLFTLNIQILFLLNDISNVYEIFSRHHSLESWS